MIGDTNHARPGADGSTRAADGTFHASVSANSWPPSDSVTEGLRPVVAPCLCVAAGARDGRLTSP
eukprot:m.1299653 g.1299653  ORF g.1299653 m.1299653 type:complete len:65 (+) comp24800_c0_seq46:1430-1624(+)